MNQSELNETIEASGEQVWEVLFSQYGEIHVHNPTMTASSYLHGASEGAADVVRHCEFGKKLYLDEQITDVVEHRSFRVEVLEHNLPFVKDMSATYELSSTDDGTTELKMVSFTSFRPGFMKYLMRGQMRKNVAKHLFGLRYYIETGNTVSQDNYADVFAKYT
ncbi:MAG: SRPBCC family protein [Actinomycetota bacterium]